MTNREIIIKELKNWKRLECLDSEHIPAMDIEMIEDVADSLIVKLGLVSCSSELSVCTCKKPFVVTQKFCLNCQFEITPSKRKL